ncbi:HAD family hydrolase [Corticibacter populi]|uniref:HAD family hydrolase n=1 Tax=Corticibacter populi TaxID=1550736 RepID=A0A3M6QU17_9BURK|nr:HAD-IA family hydrolase [Corticibacter populi]RMX06517.1 HAD family hydrolase [Corticibacter populi]RZS31922.1 phosphoglycolate phosphatase [Corticibacter populi]
MTTDLPQRRTAASDAALQPQHFRLLAFDWDGTLFDSTAIIARSIQEAVRDVGGTPPDDEQARWVIGMELGAALAKAAPDVPPAAYPQLGLRYRYHYLQHQDDIVLFDGALDLLHELKARGFVLAVATGKSRRGLDHVLASHDLQGLFDDSRTADETAGKPDPLMLQELMQAHAVPSAQVLMIGDTSHDLQMARNAGTASLGVAYGAHAGEGLHAYEPLGVMESVAQLRQWLATRVEP